MLLRTAFIVLALIATTSLYAQQQSTQPMSAAEVLKQAQHGASDVEQLRTALQSPDASTRLSTMEAMINSNNPVLVTMAIDEGNASSDVNLRNLAVRAAFGELREFTPQPVKPLSNKAANAYAGLASNTGGLKIELDGYNQSAGYFKGIGSSDVLGQISSGRLAFHSFYCTALLLAKRGTWIFQGRVNCNYNGFHFSELMWVRIR